MCIRDRTKEIPLTVIYSVVKHKVNSLTSDTRCAVKQARVYATITLTYSVRVLVTRQTGTIFWVPLGSYVYVRGRCERIMNAHTNAGHTALCACGPRQCYWKVLFVGRSGVWWSFSFCCKLEFLPARSDLNHINYWC